MAWWRSWHNSSPPARWLSKVCLLAAVVLIVLYPKPWLMPEWTRRLANLDSVLQPDHPGLAPLESAVRAKLSADMPPAEVLGVVETEVHHAVPYAFDWDTWGVMDYLPNVDETLRLGREDCDGRAVVAASLLRRMGFKAWLVTDLLHVWVETPHGETMGPTGGEKTLSGGGSGATTPKFSWKLAANLARGTTFGIAAFPLARELIVVAAIILLTAHPRLGPARLLVGSTLLIAALFGLRFVGIDAAMRFEGLGLAIAAALLAVGGWLMLAVRGSDRRPRFGPGPPESQGAGDASPG